MVGPAVAGTLVAPIGAGGAIAVDAATFLVSAAFLTSLRVPRLAKSRAATSFAAELRDGWEEVRSRTWFWVMLLRACLVLCIVIAPFQVLGPLGLRERGYTAVAWDWVTAVFSLGVIIGGAVAFRYRPKRPMLTVCLTGTTAVASPLTLALGGGPWMRGAVQGLRGIAVGLLVAVCNTALQTQVEKEALGGVGAWDWMASLALWPARLALAGPLAQSLGVTTTPGSPPDSARWPRCGCWACATCGACARACSPMRRADPLAAARTVP